MAKLTHEEFIRRVFEQNQFFANGDIELNGEYAGRHTKIPAHCNIHDDDWNAEPAKLYEGRGCPKCSREQTSQKQLLTPAEFLDKLRECNHFFADGSLELRGEYNGRHTPISSHCNIHNFDWNVYPASLYEGKGCPHCSWSTIGKHFVMSHDEFVRLVYEMDSTLIVRGTYVNNNTPIDMECKENHRWSQTPYQILYNHIGCPYCANKQVWIGFNDMWTTRPDIAKLLKDPNDGYKYTYGSGKSTYFTCPDCGAGNYNKINTVSSYGFSCDKCGDGISYPEKFGRAFLDQLSISNHECEYQPEWVKPYFYDDYFMYNYNEYIIEWDGAFHYLKRNGMKQTLEERQAIDRLKDDLAIQHHINMIRIDCLLSDANYIRQNILKSELNNIFDLSNVNWELCDQKAQSNFVKEACKLYTSGIHSTAQIGAQLHIAAGTVCRYLKTGVKFGWCDYNAEKAKAENIERLKKPVNVIDDDGYILHAFDSIASCKTQMRKMYNIIINRGTMVKHCQTHKPYKGFNFRFANETIQN